MEKNRQNRVKKEFLKITGILPVHLTNKLGDKTIRKDMVFNLLAEKVFDHPMLLDLLLKKIGGWVASDKTEFVFSLAGYIYYLKEDFAKARDFFLKAIEKNPPNLDNWFDYAFALYHLNEGEQKLAKDILFKFNLFVESYADFTRRKQNIYAFAKKIQVYCKTGQKNS